MLKQFKITCINVSIDTLFKHINGERFTVKYLGNVCIALLAISLSCTSALAGPLPEPIFETDFEFDANPPANQVELGQLLFFDKIMSGDLDTSCATCHQPLAGTGDGLSLGLGSGAHGVAVMRTTAGIPFQESAPNRIVRNSPPLFNLGWRGWNVLMQDGDISRDETQSTGFATPLGENLPEGLQNILAAQNMFPAAQPREMAGTQSDTAISVAALIPDTLLTLDLITQQVLTIPEYVTRFIDVYDDVDSADDVSFVHIANALAAYQIANFTAINSPFDRFLRGERGTMSGEQRRGMNLFFGRAGCDSCHNGPLLTDQNFYAISVPQIGPGRQFGAGGQDNGRRRVSLDPDDRFKYKTPNLRNVALTGPWGHDGAYATLEGIVRHHLDPINSLENYDTDQAVLPDRERWAAVDFIEHENLTQRALRAERNQLAPIALSDRMVNDLVAFLHALTDPASIDLNHTIPMSVPSGLPVSD